MEEHPKGNTYPKLGRNIKFKTNTELYVLFTASMAILADSQSTKILQECHALLVVTIVMYILYRFYDGQEMLMYAIHAGCNAQEREEISRLKLVIKNNKKTIEDNEKKRLLPSCSKDINIELNKLNYQLRLDVVEDRKKIEQIKADAKKRRS